MSYQLSLGQVKALSPPVVPSVLDTGAVCQALLPRFGPVEGFPDS